LRMSLGVVLAAGLIGLGAFSLAQAPGQNNLPQPEVIRVPGNQNGPGPFIAPDPFNGQYIIEQQKGVKVVPKGIEDDDVLLASTPTQAVVRVEEGKLIVRQRGTHFYTPVTIANNNGQAVTTYQRKSTVQASTYDTADVSVFDMKGNRLMPKAWKEKLKTDVHALVSFDGRLPNPRELTLFKDDTLIVVLPTASGGLDPLMIPPVARPPEPTTTIPARPAVNPTAPPALIRPGTPRPPVVPQPPEDLPPSSPGN
jgi:hypothetical protein